MKPLIVLASICGHRIIIQYGTPCSPMIVVLASAWIITHCASSLPGLWSAPGYPRAGWTNNLASISFATGHGCESTLAHANEATPLALEIACRTDCQQHLLTQPMVSLASVGVDASESLGVCASVVVDLECPAGLGLALGMLSSLRRSIDPWTVCDRRPSISAILQ